ncbi:MAG TPA: glycine--tRNA ligase subunit beta, partial [Geothrix sp.]|nr:glycine--tRNA ligase subunit beta [Geothrix sp.]
MSATKTFLLELHCEEIPARFLKPLCNEFEDALKLKLAEWKIVDDFKAEKIYKSLSDGTPTEIQDSLAGPNGPRFEKMYSPRKIAWRVSGLHGFQEDQTETQVGPPQRMCVGEDGKPTIQGL